MSTEEPTGGSKPAIEQTTNQVAPQAPLNIVYAGIGLVSLIIEALPTMLERSVQRGDRIVHQAQTQTQARRSAGRHKPTTRVSRQVQDEWQTQIDRLGLPTRSELEALNQQIDELSHQIDELAAQHTATD